MQFLMRNCFWGLLLVFLPVVATAGEGIPITADDEGHFQYHEDFQTPRFLSDGFLSEYRPNSWVAGELRNQGPGGWSLVYRFYGKRAIRDVEVIVEQAGNARSLGGINTVSISPNGLDWQQVANGGSFEEDRNKWQPGSLVVSNQEAAPVLGGNELWLKLNLNNVSGLPTSTSSRISNLDVKLSLGEPTVGSADPQAQLLKRWGKLRRQSQWRNITLDRSDPQSQRPPYYFEDADGWLRSPGEVAHLDPQACERFRVQRAGGRNRLQPLALAAFVAPENSDQSGSANRIARISVVGNRDTSREMEVQWAGKKVGQFDTASYFTQEKIFLVALPSAGTGPQELRIFGSDDRPVEIQQITIAGSEQDRWATRPELPGGGKLEVLSAYYMPDAAPPKESQAVQGRNVKYAVGVQQKHLQKMYKEHRDFGGMRVVLCNTGKVPVRIGDVILLNGQPIEEQYVDFTTSAWDARGVVWYRVRPQLVQPGACAQLYIRFRRRPAGNQASLEIPLENGKPVKISVPYTDPGITVDYVTSGADPSILYVYARQTSGSQVKQVAGLSLDGKPLPDAEIFGANFPGGVALLRARLKQPLKQGSTHTAGVKTGGGDMVTAQFRVLPWFFPRTSIHIPANMAHEMNMNLLMWNQHSLEDCDAVDLDTSSHNIFGGHERVAYVLGPDEPDAHDNRGGGYDVGLGAIARELAHNRWQQLVERFAPQANSWIIMNGTTRPLNWGVYGQVADIASFDPYPVTYYASDHAYVRESLLVARRSGAPNRMYGCMEAFGWRPGPGVPDGARGPLPEEYRQNIVQAIGSGMKGLTSWVYSGQAGGWQIDDACRDEITSVNQLIEHIEDDLLRATPVDLATSDAGEVMTGVAKSDGSRQEVWPKERVWVGALLSGPDTIVLAAANHIGASKPGPPKIEPARDVTITVELPDFLKHVSAFEVTEAGLSPVDCDLQNNQARIHLDEIRSGRVFVLRRNESAR